MLEISLGGGLQLRVDGAELPPPASKRARAVLAYLALNPGPHPRARLAGLFWPDVLDESARASLRVALTELRQALGDAARCLVTTRESLALEGPDLSVDVRAFERALRAGDPAGALQACSATILDGFDDDWAHEAREEHAHRLADALECVAAAADPAEAVRLTRAQVALDPLGEAANRRLIERLAAAGDRAAALSAGRQFAERLRGRLGIAPSRETRMLLEDLRRTELDAITTPPILARAYDTDFVGRRPELRRLHASWGEVRMRSERRIVLVAGEPGIGKTRLVHQFAAAAVADGAIVLLGRCSQEPLVSFEPFTEALGQAGASSALTPDDTESVGARHRVFDAVDSALSDLAARAPLMLVFDDLHWADRGTLLLLDAVLRSRRSGPLLVVGTYRDTELGRHSPFITALAELKRGANLDRIDLRGLALAEVARLAQSLLGDSDVAERLYARTDGNPFYVEEVLKGLAESGPGEVPESVRHAVGVRLSRMGEDANQLIAAAAILGLEHDMRAVQVTAGLDAHSAEVALDEILQARLLRPAVSAQRFEFTHALVREVVLEECNVLRRARLHRQAAEALTGLGEDRHLEEIAMHLFEAASAADARQAADMLTRAGRRALTRLAYEDAAERFARALEALELSGAEDEGGPILLARGDALLRAGDTGAARTVFTTARALAIRARDDTLLAEAALGFAGLGIAIIDVDPEVVARLEEAIERAHDDALRARLQARLAVELYYAPERTRSESISAEAIATAQRSADFGALAAALSARHVALWRPDRAPDRLTVAEDMIAAAQRADDRHAELQARNWRVADLFELGDMPACRDEIARHGRLAEELRLPMFKWYAPLWRSVEAMLAGRYDEAESLVDEAEEAGLRAGDGNAELFAGMVRFCAALEREAYDEVPLEFLEDKIAHSPAGPAYRGSYAWVLAGLGQTDRARAELFAVLEHPVAFDANWLSFQIECAESSVLLGETAHASSLYDRLAPYAGRPVTAGRAVSSYGAVDRSLGRLAALLGRSDDAIGHLRDAVRVNDALGCTVWRAHAERDLGRAVDRMPGDQLSRSLGSTSRP
jgi:DNA-binding SARP family transcriptional activator